MFKKKPCFIVLLLLFSLFPVAGSPKTELSKLNQLLFFSDQSSTDPFNLQLNFNPNFGLSLKNDSESLSSKFSWKNKDQLLLEAKIKMQTRSVMDNKIDVSRFNGLSFQPEVKFEFKDIRLKVNLDGRIAPIFTTTAFSDGNYTIHNHLNYNIQINLIDFLIPKKRDYETNIYFKGSVTQHSGYEEFTEKRITNETQMRFGALYQIPGVVNVSTGVAVITEEKFDLSLPHPTSQLLSRFNLDIEIQFFYKELEIKMNFSPNINRKGNIQDSTNTIFALSSIYKL